MHALQEGPFKPHRPERHSAESPLDAHLLKALTERAERVNQGANGYIFRLNLGEIPPSVLSSLQASATDKLDVSDQAVKILKIYRQGEGRQEADMQNRAHDIVASVSSEVQTDYAQIPKMRLYRDVSLRAEDRHSLKNQGLSSLSSRAEVLLMDFIEGDDIATALYREALRFAVREKGEQTLGLTARIESLDLEELHSHMVRLLDFRAPGGKSSNESEREYEKRKVAMENSEKLIRYLRQRNFVLDPRIISQIENTLTLLHKNGLVHRDAHLRNFMVRGPLQKQTNSETAPETFIIDFGTATTFTGDYKAMTDTLFNQVSTSHGLVNFMDDMAAIQQLKQLTKTKLESADDQRDVYFQSLRTRIKPGSVLERHPVWQKYYAKFHRQASEGFFSPESAYFSAPDRPDKIENFFSLVLALQEQSLIPDPQMVVDYLQHFIQERKPERIQRFHYLLDLLSNVNKKTTE